MSVWGNATAAGSGSAWADEVEQETKNGAIEANDPTLNAAADASFPALGTEFPSLGAAPKDKKKKKQTMSLADFQSSGSGGRSSSYGDLPTGPRSRAVDLSSLPTGPRARGDGDEGDDVQLGGAFRGYGGDRDGDRRPSRFGDRYGDRYGDRDDDRRERRGPREDEMMPSRADQASDWGAERKFVPSDDRGDRRGFGGGFRDGDRGGFGERRERDPPREREPSRADTSDDWGANRPVPTFDDRGDRGDRRGFGDRRDGRDGGFGRPVSRADEADRWGRSSAVAEDDAGEKRERPRLKLKPRTKPVEEFGASSSDAMAKEVEQKLNVA